MNTIALFSDQTILPGTHATLVSLLQHNIHTSPLSIILFSDKLSLKDKANLYKTFELHKKTHQQFVILESPDTYIKGANALHGNTTTYGRLFLADLLPDKEKVLYLDTDLIIQVDVNNIFDKMTDEFILYTDGTGVKNYSLDKNLFLRAGLDLNSSCFNAGVLGINLKRWREEDGLKRCIENIKKYPGCFRSADQAVLNVTFSNEFYALGRIYNHQLHANSKDIVNIYDKEIFHFVGSPKPWDFLGKYFHNHYRLWENYYCQSAVNNHSILRYTSLRRTILISRSYIKRVL